MKRIITLQILILIMVLWSCEHSEIEPYEPEINYGSGVYDIEGNLYKTVRIGNQEWMAENLRTSKYSDGTAIQNVVKKNDWDKLADTAKAWCLYGNYNKVKNSYGALYTWSASARCKENLDITIEKQGVCPEGWHLPDKDDWEELLINLGGRKKAGNKMKQTKDKSWHLLKTKGYNKSGFSALPGGMRYKKGNYYSFGFNAYFWSSSIDTNGYPLSYSLSDISGEVTKDSYSKKSGLSVRCIRD